MARHRWLCRRRDRFVERMRHDPDYFNPKVAAWWCWGASAWLGSGYCCGDGKIGTKKPRLNVNGIFALSRRERIESIFEAISKRLRHAVICCGDWSRCWSQSILASKQIGLFLDPPYAFSTGRDETIYRVEMPKTDEVGRWCRDNGKRRNVRIVLAGFDGEYDLPGWRVLGWKRKTQFFRSAQAVANLARERLWLSPHCLPVDLPTGRPKDAPVWAVSRPRRRAGRTAERRRHRPNRERRD